MMSNINLIKEFWENNPLFSGESNYESGSKQFFQEHKRVYVDDVFAGNFEENKFFPKNQSLERCLDLGCGVGFWTIMMIEKLKIREMYSSDLTEKAIRITKKRLKESDFKSNLSVQNGEKTSFKNDFFDFINCQGVIHHTENPDKMISEIHRILKEGGKTSISVYYNNFFLRNWKLLFLLGKLFYFFGVKFKGRGRERILSLRNSQEIVRLYDGDKNPKGISYTKKNLNNLLKEKFEINKVFLYYFPSRIFPFSIPKIIHKILAKHFGFMICYLLTKK